MSSPPQTEDRPEDPVRFRLGSGAESRKRKLGAFLAARVGCERARCWREALLLGPAASSVATWALARWPALQSGGLRRIVVVGWELLFCATLVAASAEWLSRRRWRKRVECFPGEPRPMARTSPTATDASRVPVVAPVPLLYGLAFVAGLVANAARPWTLGPPSVIAVIALPLLGAGAALAAWARRAMETAGTSANPAIAPRALVACDAARPGAAYSPHL